VHTLDYTVFFLYLLGIFAVGVGLALKNRSAEDMFAAGGESPWWTSGLSGFMTMFSAGTFVVWGGIAYKHGLVAVMINLCYGVAALLVGAFVAGRWKRLGVKTPAQFIELRFGPAAVQFSTWAMMAFRIIGVAVSLYSLSIILVAMMPLAEGNPLRDPATGNLSLAWAVLIFGGIVVIYTMAGGLWAVLMTDVLQFIVLNLAVLFVVPLAFGKVEGVAAFVNKAPEGFFALTTNKYTWFFMFGWVMIHFFMVGAEWAFAQRFICVPNEKDAKKSAYLFGALYLVSPLVWLLPPMLYRVIDPAADPEQAYILACRAVLPAGMVGLMVAAMFSATASMVSSQLNVFAGVLTDQFYRRLFSPRASDKRLIGAGRVFTMLLGAVLVGVALAIPYLGGAEKLIITTASLMVGPLLAPTIWGLFSRRVDIKAIWITAGISFAIGVVAKLGLAPEGPLVTERTRSISDWIQANGTTVDLVIGIVVPIIVLFMLQYLAKSTADGWEKVDQLIQETQSSGAKKQASNMPAVIVGGSLTACAALMFALMAWNQKDRALLGGFGAVLLLISGTIFAVLCIQRNNQCGRGGTRGNETDRPC
jgi:Na+/proline symporter